MMIIYYLLHTHHTVVKNAKHRQGVPITYST